MWISREQDTIAAGRECALATYTDTSGNYLAATLPVKSAEETEEGLAKAPSGLMYFAAGGKMPAEICRTAETEYNDKVTRYAGTEVYSDGVGAILGYGGFLYTARGSGVATSMRGNPFVTRCATTTVGGEVTAMWPRLNGGGAFTRQYIYLATPNGVAALTHKEDGTHTNCRMLSSERVESVRMGVAAPDGVYAVSSAGNLLRLRDSQSEVLIRGLTGTRAVCWSNLHGELWLSGGAGKGSVVLSDPGARKGFTSSFGFSERLDSLPTAAAARAATRHTRSSWIRSRWAKTVRAGCVSSWRVSLWMSPWYSGAVRPVCPTAACSPCWPWMPRCEAPETPGHGCR